MSAFMESLWNSIFVPGPTPPLLLATNVTFGALQFILFALLLATYSLHFVILSTLCAGLWWAINWFAAELRVAQLQDEEDKQRTGESTQGGSGSDTDVAGSGNEAEYEAEAKTLRQGVEITTEDMEGEVIGKPIADPSGERYDPQSGAIWNTSAVSRLAPQITEETIRKRRSLGDSTELSTDSEWERVEKDK